MNKRLVWHTEAVSKVVDLLLECRTKEEIETIFDKVLTPREINDIARRHEALLMIEAGNSYSDVMQKTGMSSVTISRLSMKCGYGFRKSSGLNKKKKISTQNTPKRKLRYKGVHVLDL